jgi:hypothetical protein
LEIDLVADMNPAELSTKLEAVIDRIDGVEKHLRERIDEKTDQLEQLIRDGQRNVSGMEKRVRTLEVDNGRLKLALGIVGAVGLAALGTALKVLFGT